MRRPLDTPVAPLVSSADDEQAGNSRVADVGFGSVRHASPHSGPPLSDPLGSPGVQRVEADMTPTGLRGLADTATAAAVAVEAFERAVTGGRDVAVTDLTAAVAERPKDDEASAEVPKPKADGRGKRKDKASFFVPGSGTAN
jgi:hypothetical protein